MMYPFMTLPDDTEITHSEILTDNTVKVYVEKPDAKDGFHNAVCWLPECRWDEIYGFSDDEIKQYYKSVCRTARRACGEGWFYKCLKSLR